MKIFFALSVIFFSGGVANSTGISDELIELANRFPDFWQALFETLGQRHAGSLGRSKEARDPVIPKLDDPLILPDPLNFTLDIDLIRGNGSFRGAIIEGLSTLTDDLTAKVEIIPPRVTVNYRLDLTSFSFHGDYDADLIVDLTSFGYPVMDLRGGGEYNANLSGVFVDVSAVVVPRFGTLKVTVQSLSLDLGFQAINLWFENAILNGDPIDYWDEINKGLKVILDYVWPENKVEIQEVVRGIVNDIIVDCTIAQLLALIDGTGDGVCLNLPSLPSVPPPSDPTATVPTNAPTSERPPPSEIPPSYAPPSEIPSYKPPASTEPNNASDRILLSVGILVVAFMVSLLGL